MTTNPGIKSLIKAEWPTTARGFEQWSLEDCQIIHHTNWQAGDNTTSFDGSTPENCLLFVNGHWCPDLSTLKADTSIRLTSADQNSTHSSWQKSMETTQALSDIKNACHAPASHNAKHTSSGLIIDIAPHCELERPIIIKHISTHENIYHAPRVILNIGENSHIRCQHIITHSAHNTWHNGWLEIHCAAHAHAKVSHISHRNTHCIAHQYIHITQAKNSFCHVTAHQAHTHYHRLDVKQVLAGERATTHWHGLMQGLKNQNLQQNIDIFHEAPYTESHQCFRALAIEPSLLCFRGTVHVNQQCPHIVAHQRSDQLSLSQRAKLTNCPQLNIRTDEVTCTHGATIGQLDQNALLYLQARGLSETKAKSLLTRAFVQDIVQQVPWLPNWESDALELIENINECKRETADAD